MSNAIPVLLIAIAVALGGALYIWLYIRFHWQRTPHAYRATIALAVGFFVAGALAGISLTRLVISKSAPAMNSTSLPSPTLSSPTPGPVAMAPFDLGPLLHYDPAAAVRPDSSLTPGDILPDATKDDVCTPGWSKEHRHVTEDMRDQVYAEYGRSRGPGCCEVDHLIALELGGSNEMENLWPQPDEPRPGAGEKDQLENTLHGLVCSDKMELADAQRCIASDWVTCWVKYVVPEYGPVKYVVVPE